MSFSRRRESEDIEPRRRYPRRDEEDSADEPRRKRKKKKKRKKPATNPAVFWIVGAVVVVVLLIGTVATIWWAVATGSPAAGHPVVRNEGKNPGVKPGNVPPGEDSEAVAFHRKLTAASRNLMASNEDLKRATGVPSLFRPQLKKTQETLGAIRREVPGWKVPNSDQARALHAAFLEVLTAVEQGLNIISRVQSAVDNRQPTDNFRLEAMQADSNFQTKVSQFNTLEQAFAAHHKLIIMP